MFATTVKVALVFGFLWLLACGVMTAANSMFIQNEEYILKDIELETNGYFTKQRVVDETRIKKGATVFSVDPEFMEITLKDLPDVVDAEVKRIMPNKLSVKITEHVPVARLDVRYMNLSSEENADGFLIGETGYIFPCKGPLKQGTQDLPVIVVDKGESFAFRSGEKMEHEEALRAQNLVLEHNVNTIGEGEGENWRLKRIKVIDFYTLIAEYSDGVLVKYGMYDHKRQVRDLIDIRKHAELHGKKLHWLDLRPTRNIPGQYKLSST
jgi:hypothetical protein